MQRSFSLFSKQWSISFRLLNAICYEVHIEILVVCCPLFGMVVYGLEIKVNEKAISLFLTAGKVGRKPRISDAARPVGL